MTPYDESVDREGVFDTATSAIRAAKKRGFRVNINTTLFTNVFGWQKPCYLLVDEGYVSTFKELIEETDWANYGVGRNPKCANCMAHCGFEGTAADDTFRHPLKALWVSLRGPKLAGPFAPDIHDLDADQGEYCGARQ